MGETITYADDKRQVAVPPMIAPNIPSSQEKDFFKFRIDSTDIIAEIQHHLKGEVFVADQYGMGKYVQQFEQEMTNEGVNEVVGMIFAFGINKNTLLGCLTHDEIYERCNSIWKELATYFILNGNRVLMKKDRRSILLRKIVYMVHSGLSRSELGKEAKQLSQAVQRVEHSMEEVKQEKKFDPIGRLMHRGK